MEYLSSAISSGDLIEFQVGLEQGTGLFVVGKATRPTRRGVWIDGVLLGASDASWRQWFDIHGDLSAPDAIGLFHVCTAVPCKVTSPKAERHAAWTLRPRVLQPCRERLTFRRRMRTSSLVREMLLVASGPIRKTSTLR